MGILSGNQIRKLCEENNLVTPFNPDCLNAASIDVHTGYTACIEDVPTLLEKRIEQFGQTLEAYKPNFVNIDLLNFHVGRPYMLQPQEFILVATKEQFNLPPNVAGEFRLRSSFARMGYDCSLAVWLEPCWHGSVLTMELRNNLRMQSLPIYPELRLGQVIFKNVNESDFTYLDKGNYNNDLTVTQAKF